MLTDVIVEEEFDRNEEDLWYSRKDLEHGKTRQWCIRCEMIAYACTFHQNQLLLFQISRLY